MKICFLFFSILLCLSIDGLSQEKVQELLDESTRFRAESKYDSALMICQEVLELFRYDENPYYLSKTYLEIGIIYYSTRRYQFGLDAWNEAIKYAQKAENRGLEMTGVYNLGLMHHSLENYDSADYYYNSALSYYLSVKNEVRLGQIYSGLGALDFSRSEYKRAIDFNLKSVFYYKRTNQNRYLANRYHQIGDSYLILAQYDTLKSVSDYLDSSSFYFNKSVELCDSLGFPDPQYVSLRGLAIASKMRGNMNEAYEFMDSSSLISQRLFSQDVEDKLLELREKYNTANLELEAEQAISRSLRIEKNRNIVLIVSVALIIIFSIWLYVLDQRRKNIKAIAEKNDEINKQRIDELLQQQEISSLQGVLEGQEKERKRVAIDLHDRLGGILSMVKLHFSSVEEKLPDDNPEKKKFLTASEMLDLAAGEVRNISHDLLSGVLAKFGLIPALKDLTSSINESGEIKLNLIYKGVEEVLTGEQELQIYRITQEMISNILKHSEAKEATIQLLKNENESSVNLFVEDDGQGFDPEENKSDGIGLTNLKARVEKLKGDLHIDSGRGVGTSISIDIPIEND